MRVFQCACHGRPLRQVRIDSHARGDLILEHARCCCGTVEAAGGSDVVIQRFILHAKELDVEDVRLPLQKQQWAELGVKIGCAAIVAIQRVHQRLCKRGLRGSFVCVVLGEFSLRLEVFQHGLDLDQILVGSLIEPKDAKRLVTFCFRRQNVALLNKGRCPAIVGPDEIFRSTGLGQIGVIGQRLIDIAVRLQIDRPAIGLGLGIDRFGGALYQRIGIDVGTRDGASRRLAGACGDHQTCRSARDFAGDMGFMPQPLAQKTIQLTDGNSGLGNFHLDVIVPGDGIGRGWPVGRCLQLQVGQPVQHMAGGDLAGHAARRQVGRHREGLDHQSVAVRGIPHHDGDGRRRGHPDKGRRYAQQNAKAFLPDAEAQIFQLLARMMNLNIRQRALFAQENIGLVAAGALQGQRHGDRVRTNA